MDAIYPEGPAAVPADLAVPSATYRRNAWVAMLALGGFVLLYFLLSGWFAWSAWHMFTTAPSYDPLPHYLTGACAAFLAVFMLKALFFVQHHRVVEDIEITREEQPLLFEFIDRLADEARAPRAHRVYLTPDVNASVFYDLSALNLFVPSKKNLNIGLGLVNVLTLGELKAVLAHEFGHFGQKSMAVGRWVYVSQQIAGHIVARRDILDRLLRLLSRFDLRIAWVGWILSLIVWSIRSLMDVLFRGVVLAQRALSRQMEFQADLVAVSLTGSDALVHALHRLGAADDAWSRTVGFANGQLANNRAVADLFAIQSRIIERMGEILNQPYHGRVPPLPSEGREQHRVFSTSLAQPPRMWMTHPPCDDREVNAKRRYVAATIDERSAWDVFVDAPVLRMRMSAHLQRHAKDATVIPHEQALSSLDRQYASAWLEPRYRGAYLRRSVVRGASGAAALTGAPPADVDAALAALYPESLADDVEELNALQAERNALRALLDQVAVAPGGIIRHRGVEVQRASLPAVMAEVDAELAAVEGRIAGHDRSVRDAHLAAARQLGDGWDPYLRGLLAALHYAEHVDADLRDAQSLLGNVYAIVTADGRVSGRELKRLIAACEQLHSAVEAVHAQASQVRLDPTLLGHLGVASWSAAIGTYGLPTPAKDNVSEWLGAIDSWVGAATTVLGALRYAALEQLLVVEDRVRLAFRSGGTLGAAPSASMLPMSYPTLLPGAERPRQGRLDWWDRFQTADGAIAALLRLLVAVGIIGGVILFSTRIG